jgi:hypothetical protein
VGLVDQQGGAGVEGKLLAERRRRRGGPEGDLAALRVDRAGAQS